MARFEAHVCQSPSNGRSRYNDGCRVDGTQKIQMTMRYAHLAPAHKLDAVERLCAQPSGAANTSAANTSQK